MLLPWPLSRLFSAVIGAAMRRDPTLAVSMGGTVGVTAVGMFGEGHSGWGIFPMTQALALVVGSIAWKPAVVEERIVPREILHLTVTFDHDIVDGAPAARFTRRLLELIESAYGLDEAQPVAPVGAESWAARPVQVPA
jgi:pyruvate/2-oxoglutarate dehydrogenase complex dihydrolipoamide acyltransferase (E2) component